MSYFSALNIDQMNNEKNDGKVEHQKYKGYDLEIFIPTNSFYDTIVTIDGFNRQFVGSEKGAIEFAKKAIDCI